MEKPKNRTPMEQVADILRQDIIDAIEKALRGCEQINIGPPQSLMMIGNSLGNAYKAHVESLKEMTKV